MDKIFKLKENGTNVRTEIIAGLTTFMTMAYIIALNPNILANYAAGTPLWNAVFLATCLASGIAMVCMAFYANKPFCLAPGMGLNSFFAIVVADLALLAGVTYEVSFRAALIIILAEGIVFIILTALNIREKIVEAIPLGVRLGIGPAIGLMLMNIGFGSNVYIPNADYSGSFYMMRDFFGALVAKSAAATMGDAWTIMVISVATTLIGLFAIVLLNHKGVRGAVILGMIIAAVIYWICEFIFLDTNPFAALATASWAPPFADLASMTLFKFSWSTFAQFGWATIVTLIVTFVMIDMFDTIGTLVGTASRAGMLDDEGRMPQMKQALMSDAVGTVVGSCMGTSTVTTFVESASGVEAGGRTGLTALTCGIVFILCIFIAPIAAIIPAAATSAALIYVGILMISGLSKIHFDKIEEVVPVSLMLLAMPISSSIGNGIGLGLIAFSIINICTGKAEKKYILTYVLALLFLVKFFWAVG